MRSKPKIFTTSLALAVLSVAAFTFSQVLNIKEVKGATLENTNTRTLEVTGTSSIKAKPDIAVLNIGVTTNDVSTKSVQSENSKVMNEILAKVKDLGVDENDIRTTSYYMYPEYDYSESGTRGKIVGYTLSNMVEIKVRDMDKAGEVLSAAVDAGANVNNGISFNLSNVDEYYNQALSSAMANAKSKADTLAKAIGVKIGVPSKIVEGSNYYSPYLTGNYLGMGSVTSEPEAIKISEGEIEVTANVLVTYEY